MKEYIEREALRKAMHFATDDPTCPLHIAATVDQYITEAPAADVVERKRGEWVEHEWAEEENGFLISNFECSACHEWERKTSDFCPNCGADMRGENNAVD